MTLEERGAAVRQLVDALDRMQVMVGVVRGPELICEYVSDGLARWLELDGCTGKPIGSTARCALLREPLAAVLQSGAPLRSTEVALGKDADAGGGFYDLEMVPLGADGGTGAVVLHAIDATPRVVARRAAEEQAARLLQAQKHACLEVLAGGIAHDFNNLLTAVIGNVATAAEVLPPGSRAAPMLEDALLASTRAADVTRQLLAYAGKARWRGDSIDLSAQIREMSLLLAAALPESVRLELDLPSDLPPVLGDASQIQQLVTHLVKNAAESMAPKAGIVRVSTGLSDVGPDSTKELFVPAELRPGPHVFLEVRDTGEGMDAETMSKAFDPFFTTKFPGRGLGLAVALGIVRGHGGGVKVTSAPGHGTTFTVLVPCGDVTARARGGL